MIGCSPIETFSMYANVYLKNNFSKKIGLFLGPRIQILIYSNFRPLLELNIILLKVHVCFSLDIKDKQHYDE